MSSIQPAQSNQSNQPAQPSQSNQSAQPNQPAQPNQANQSAQPNQSAQSNQANQSAQPNQPARPHQPARKKKSKAKRFLMLTFLGTGTWVTLFMNGVVTLGGVPYSVINTVWQNPATRAALLRRDSYQLHDLMDNMGIEAEIKRYYSKRIEDPVELDQHIHQILYDRTRYVGANYVVVRGKLMPKSYDMVEEIYECPEC